MITASIVTYNNNVLDLEAVLRSLLISPVQKVWIIDHSDVFTRLEGELNEYMRNDEEFRKHVECGFLLKYVKHRNNGYGGGHNVAICEAIAEGSEYHLVINPDVWFGPEVVPAIWKAMENDRSIAQIMPKVLYLNGEVQYVAKLLPSPLDLIGRFFFPHFMIRKRNDRHELKHSGYDKVMNVPFLSGCFMFLRVSALKEIGLFDERFFMYAEDIDISRRLHSRYKTLFYPKVTIYHRFSRLSYHNWRISLIHIVSVIKYFNKWGWMYDSERRRVNKVLLNEISGGCSNED